MEDADLLTIFLGMVNINKKDIGLVAEMVHTIDEMVRISEKDLQKLSWPEKTLDERKLLTSAKIDTLLLSREEILFGVPHSERARVLREHLLSRREKGQLTNFLSGFIPTEIAANISVRVGSLEALIDQYSSGSLEATLRMDSPKAATELNAVLARAISTPRPIDTLRQVAQDRKGYGLLVAVAAYANRLIKDYTDFDLKKFLVQMDSLTTIANWNSIENNIRISIANALGKADAPLEILNIAKRSYCVFSGLLPQERQVVFTFANATRKVLIESVPRFLLEAMHTSHPFLIRPLFRSYPSALIYAAGGKIASSLETFWGDVGEELFIAMAPSLHPVRNGGIDVVQGRDAYDIKSGPAVMNKDQIAILRLKQRIIGQEKRVPGLDTFRVALVYGQASAIFGTMASDLAQGNILTARTAWERLTGDPLAPERVYALAGLVADIVGVAGAIEAVSTDTLDRSVVLDQDPAAYDDEFSQIFDKAFDPPNSKPKDSLDRLEKIRELDEYVRSLLKE